MPQVAIKAPPEKRFVSVARERVGAVRASLHPPRYRILKTIFPTLDEERGVFRGHLPSRGHAFPPACGDHPLGQDLAASHDVRREGLAPAHDGVFHHIGTETCNGPFLGAQCVKQYRSPHGAVAGWRIVPLPLGEIPQQVRAINILELCDLP